MQQNDTPSAKDLGGRYHRLGQTGPAYQVGVPLRQLERGDWLMRVRLLESGEEVERAASKIKQDPSA